MSEHANGYDDTTTQTPSTLRELRRVPEANAERGFVVLGELLHGMRRAKGLSRRQLSEVAGVDPDTISNVELAVHVPRQETLRRLALALIEPVEAWSIEKEDEDERRCASDPGSTDRVPPPAARERVSGTADPAAPPTAARDGFVLVEKTIVTTETWRAEQRAEPERMADVEPA